MLLGLGLAATGDKLDVEITGFLTQSPKPSSTQVAEFLRIYPAGVQRTSAAQALIARGVDPKAISNALTWLATSEKWDPTKLKGVLSIVAAGGMAFHGYRRNRGSIGWAIAWFLGGLVAPVIGTAIAFAQGYGKAK